VRTAAICGLLVFGTIALAQDKPDASELLREVAKVYGNAKQCHLAGEAKISERLHGAASERVSAHQFLIAFQAPDKVHLEMTPGDGGRAIYVVSNGKSAWLYSPTNNEYMKVQPGTAPATPMGDADVEVKTAVPYAMQMARQFLQAFEVGPQTTSAIVKDEDIAIGGERAACYVIAIKGRPGPGSVTTWWIDQKRHVLLREEIQNETKTSSESATTVYTTVSIDEPLPDALFLFTPPPKARLVKRMGR
jgi:outer membrane lipoprotein-sorting protein